MARDIYPRLVAILGILAIGFSSIGLLGCGGSKENYKYQIVVIPKGLTHEHWQSVQRGAERAAADLAEQGIAVKVMWDGPRTESDAQEQIKIVDRHVANRVNGIVIAPQHSETMVAPIERAVKQNIPIVVLDSDLNKKDLYIKYVATNNYNGGRMAAERLLKVLNDQGKQAPRLLMLRYDAGSESTEQREKGFEEVINEAVAQQNKKGEPTINLVVAKEFAGSTTDSALAVSRRVLNQLVKEGDVGIDGIFTPNESSTMGMLKAMESMRINKKVRLVGFDSSPPLLQAVKDGDVDGLVLQDPYRMGYLGVWNVVQHLEGFNVAPDGKKEQGTGEIMVTRENVDEPRTRELFTADLQAKRKLETPTLPKR